MRKCFFVCAILLLSSNAVFPQGGDAGMQILELGYSARSLSLASSNDALTNEPTAIFTNPAGLASTENERGIGLDFMLTHRTYFAGTTIDMFGSRFEGGGLSFGTSILYSRVPDIPVREVAGDAESTFDAGDFAFAFGMAHHFGSFDVGVSALYLYEKLFVYQSTGYAFNLGMDYYLDENFKLGLSAGNLGSSSAMISDRIALPEFVRVGGSYSRTIDDNFSLVGYLDLSTFKSGGITPSVGADLNYQKFLDLRAGYASGTSVADLSTGFSFGAGVSYSFLRLDYSYIPLKLDFGNSQTFTLSFAL